MQLVRIQKLLAEAGIASRREADRLLKAGSVTVNGKVAQPGDRASTADAIKVNGKLVKLQAENKIYLAFNKPKNVICMTTKSDDDDRKTLKDFIPKNYGHLFPVGRMDFKGEGLVILTNDGTLTQSVQKKKDLLRRYEIKVKGEPAEVQLKKLANGMKLGNKYIKPASVKLLQKLSSKSKIELTFEGTGSLDVREYMTYKGFLVDRVIRTAFGKVRLRGMLPGTVKALAESQIKSLGIN